MTPAGKLAQRQVQTIVAFKRLTEDEIARIDATFPLGPRPRVLPTI